MSRRLIFIGVLVLLAVGLWRREHLASSSTEGEREREVGAAPTHAPDPVARAGSARPVRPAIEAGALRLEGVVLDDEERPLGGARVTLDGARTTTTEADGSFAFDDLAPRDYALIAEIGEWYGEETEATLDEESDPVTIKMTRGPTVRVHVIGQSGVPIAGAAIGTSSRDVISDAAGIGILRGVDTGTERVNVSAVGHAQASVRVVTGDDPTAIVEQTIVLLAGAPLAGTVIDEDGKLVADASVEIEAPNGDRVESVSTDELGVWTSENVAAGTFMLRATSGAHVATRDITVQHDGVGKRSGLVVRVARGGQVVGIVRDEQGKPVEGADVSIGRRRAPTGADGRFVAAGLDPDRYDVVASTKQGASTSKLVVVAPNSRSEIELVIQASTIAGIVVDSDGLPIEGVTVYARSTDPNGIGVGYSDEHGKFDLGGVPPGHYDVEAQRPDQVSPTPGVTAKVSSGTRNVRLVLTELTSVTGRVVHDGAPVPYFGVAVSSPEDSLDSASPRAVRETKGTFTERGLTAGMWRVTLVGPGFERKVIENVRLTSGETLDLGDIVVGGGELVSGRVVDEHGRGVEGAKVELTTDGSSSDTERLRGLVAGTYVTTTDARGEFRFDGTRASERRKIAATHPRHGVSGDQELAAGQREVRIQLQATGSISGLLVNLTPDVRVYNVSASLVDGEGGSSSADIDASGRYELANLPVGVYEVRLRGQVIVARQQITVVAGERAELDFELPRDPVTLTVQVTGSCSLLWLRPLGSVEILEYETCSSGTATFRGVSAGSYDLCPENENCRPIEVPAQREVTVQLAVQS